MLALHLGSQARDVGVAPPGCSLKSPVSLSRHPAPPSPPSSLAGAPRLARTPSQDSGCTLGKGSFPPSTLAGVGVLGASVHRVTQAASWETPGGHRQAPAGASLLPSFSSCPLPAPTRPVCEAPTQGQTLRAVSAFRDPDWTAASGAAPGGREGSSELERQGLGRGTAGRAGSLSVQRGVGGVCVCRGEWAGSLSVQGEGAGSLYEEGEWAGSLYVQGVGV